MGLVRNGNERNHCEVRLEISILFMCVITVQPIYREMNWICRASWAVWLP